MANVSEPPSDHPGGTPKMADEMAVWVKAERGYVPPGAVAGGKDVNGEAMYVARAEHKGALIPGKLCASHGCAYIPWGGEEIRKGKYEVLVGGPNNWTFTRGSEVPPWAFRGGKSEDNEILYIGRVELEGSLTIGKVQKSHGSCYIPFAGKEHRFSFYEILMP